MPSTALPVVAMDGDAGAMQQITEGRVPRGTRPRCLPGQTGEHCTCMRSSMLSDLKRPESSADAVPVIELNRLHGNGTFFVNPDLVETIEARPDTTVTLVNKTRFVVEDDIEAVIERIIEFRARISAVTGGHGDPAAGARVVPVFEDLEEERAA
ncbi:MAG: hypothetical protein JWL76_1805 [Thermoleophilia bacterium]|nr:hypothetical protein [Thermoleophilia bacterium]